MIAIILLYRIVKINTDHAIKPSFKGIKRLRFSKSYPLIRYQHGCRNDPAAVLM